MHLHRLPRRFLAASTSIALAYLACSPEQVPVPTACLLDAECPLHAHCLQATCTADIPPRAGITGPATALTRHELVFDGSSSTDGDDDIVAYTWSVHVLRGTCTPDLGESTGSRFRPVFPCPGEFEVILVVTDRTGVVSEPAVAPLSVVDQP